MRVVITVPWSARLGGAEAMLWTFLRNVDRARVEPTLVFFEPGPFARDAAALGLRVEVIPAGRMRELHRAAGTIVRLARLLRAERPELLLDWSAKTHLYGAAAAALAGMPSRTAWWQHGIQEGTWIDRAANAMPARAVICYSEAAAKAQERLRPTRRVIVVPAGTETPAPRSPERLNALRGELGIPGGRLVVGVVGRLQPWKRQDVLIQAVARLLDRGRDVHALVVGGDAYRLSPDYGPHLRRVVSDLAVGDRVTFTGQVDDTGAHMRLMDVLVNASENEPFGIVLIEAMALGIPVVAFAGGGPAEIVVDGATGALVRGDPIESLARALEPLVDDAELRRRLGEAGRRRFEDRYTAQAVARRLENELEILAERG